MNYRHGYHAGNFADVVKHIGLIAILQHLKRKDTAFSVVDSHAGRGLYDLSAAEAGRTGEAKAGIGRLLDLSGEMPEALATYLTLAKQKQGWYPGSDLPLDEAERSRKLTKFGSVKYVLPKAQMDLMRSAIMGQITRLLPAARFLYWT